MKMGKTKVNEQSPLPLWKGSNFSHTIHLPPEWVDKMSALPESGMGFQRVTVIMNKTSEYTGKNETREGVIFNGGHLDTVVKISSVDEIKDILMRD